MAYRIVYGGEIPLHRKREGDFLRIKLLTAVFLVVFALAVRQYWPEGTERLRGYLLPGEDVRQEEFQNLIMQQVHYI